MDEQAGDLLAELERAGVADNTIVFYFSDHGGALPRGKRNLHDSGTRVPLIVRFPEKWSKFAPAKPGDWDDTLVSFVDFPATLLSLCDTAIPANYEGRPWLGFRAATPRRHVFLFRGRMDERYDTARGVCDGEYRYILNFSPHRPWGQHYAYPFRVLPSMRSWHEEFLAGRCNDVQASYWRPKPAEELYRLADDPHEINNLADDPAHTERLNQLRAILKGEMLATRDTGLIPEGMMRRLAGEQTIYEYAQSSEFPAKTVLELASKAAQRDQATLPEFVAAMNHPHPVPRYWGAMGCLLLGKAAKPAKDALLQRLDDPMFDARVVAAEALATLGETDRAIQSLAAVLEHGQPYEVLAAQNALDALRAAGLISLEQAQQLLRSGARAEPLDRIPQYVLGLRETTAGKKETPASSTRQRD